MSNWVRGTGERPESRTIVLRYKTANEKCAIIEDLITHIPFGKQNEVLLECIRIAAPAMLRALQGNQPNLAVTAVPPVPNTAAQPAVAPLKAPAFSPASKAMFSMAETPEDPT